jgi:hypothetical protein
VYVVILLVAVGSIVGTLALWAIWYLKNSDLQQTDVVGELQLSF